MNKRNSRSPAMAFVLGMFVTAVSIGGYVAYQTTGLLRATSPDDERKRTTSESGIVQVLGNGLLPSPVFAEGKVGDVSLADIAETASPSVVNISTTRRQQARRSWIDDFFGAPRSRGRSAQSLGSGVILSKDGVVVTNRHVVEGATEIKVMLSDGREFTAENVGEDADTDLAVLKLKTEDGEIEDLIPIELGDSSRLRVADWVMAIGNPFGLSSSVTLGIVSATGRSGVGILDKEDFIQTDAAINPGNSGGALIDMEGRLVGINTAILSKSGGYQGIGFAIPANLVKAVTENILRNGKVVPGWLGVVVEEADSIALKSLGVDAGIRIDSVREESPAADAGLAVDDVLVEINGQLVSTPQSLGALLSSLGAGAPVELTIYREGQQRKLSATLGSPQAGGGGGFGDSAASIDEGMLKGLSIQDSDDGIQVTAVAEGSFADQMGFQVGDVVTMLNRKAVTTVTEFADNYDANSRSIQFTVDRNGFIFSRSFRG